MQLDDVRVLDLTRLLPGPYATQLLADLGAEIIKIEDPNVGDYARWMPPRTDDGTGAIFAAVNRGKQSVALDLKSEDGIEAFFQLLEDADVVVEGFRPGVAERLGVDYDTVSERNPDVVYCSITGYGQDGPHSDRAGHDLGYVGLSGLLDMTRSGPDATPQIPGYPIADMAGGMSAAFGIVSGLLSRELGDGTGTYLDVSLTDAVVSFSQVVALPALLGDKPRPSETHLTGALPWYGVYETADGAYVTLSALEEKFWIAFCEAIDRPDLEGVHGTEDPAERDALREELESIFAERTRSAWADLEEVDVPVEPVLSPAEALEHPQIESRGMVRRAENGYPAIVSPITADGSSGREGVPDHGEHMEAVLEEAGDDRAELDGVGSGN
ncbi:CoA transferase [Halostagnicola sp. A-GB9-2]|uniref:CaiB/BaiF CoA transferase family protein n=1 Tax=Halostagnicola sp. A-GB9-2 TaxID=3048066 RepID=UPI0024C04C5C|nr:CoA transferase [Halostagnicola sp. A-GB9-2]MDJ1431544.1 CoA transferase [Halostagnicola sp. A-GB9-2]